MRFLLSLTLFLSLAAATMLPARAQDIPPGTPPDIAAIMRRLQSGGRPTPADIAKLTAWSKKVLDKVNVPGAVKPTRDNPHPVANTAKLGIPCQVVVTTAYQASGNNSRESCQLSLTAQASLIPRIDGTGDYFGAMLDPDAHVSSFQVALPLVNGKLPKSGSGAYHLARSSPDGSETFDGKYENTAAGFTLATTGRGDRLFGAGTVGGLIRGTVRSTGKDGTHTAPWVGEGTVGGPGVTVPFAAEAAGPEPKPGTPTAAPAMNLSYQKLVAAIQSGRTQTVTATESFAFARGGMRYTGNVMVAITLRPKTVQLIVEPVDTALYRKWLPMPDAAECGESKFFGDPKPLQVHVVLQDGARPPARRRGTMTAPNVRVGGKLSVSLSDMTPEPGLCMNYPREGETRDGLFFPRTQPAGIRWVDDRHVETTSPTATEAIVAVAARDTAAYATIQAECTTLGLHSVYPEKQTPFLSLPLDDNANHIADRWEKDNGIYDKSYGADWDDEETPSRWKSKGDGLTLFEEYRGFLVEPTGSAAEKFQRLTPGRRKLFLDPEGADKALYKAAAQSFTSNFGIDTYILHGPDRLKHAGNKLYDSWINFNKTPFTAMPQYAVPIRDNNRSDGGSGVTVTIYSSQDDQVKAQCPTTVDYVDMSRREATSQITSWQSDLPPITPAAQVLPQWKNAALNMGLDLAQVGGAIPQSKAALIDELLTLAVMHELGHCVGGRHHALDRYVNTPAPDGNGEHWQDECYSSGDHACIMRYWQADSDHAETLMFLSGAWKLTGPLSGGRWTFCDAEDTRNLHLKP